MKYAEVILPLPLENTYTYCIPVEMEPMVWKHCLVTVPFGKKRCYTAIVKEIHDHLPDDSFECKAIIAVHDVQSIINPRQMRFWEWIASYYLCKLGDVFKAAIPSGLINNDMLKRYAAKKEVFIRLTAVCKDEEVLNALFDSLKKAKQQERLLLTYMELACPFQPELTREVSKKALLKASNMQSSILDGLIKRKILESYEREVNRIYQPVCEYHAINVLTETQQTAFAGIQKAFKTKSVCLLHGISMCGKTEIYMHLITDTLQQGLHVLYLLPEIAVTDRITERMKCIFGDRLLVYHSDFSDHQRIDRKSTRLNSSH